MPVPVPLVTQIMFLATWPDAASLERFRGEDLAAWQRSPRHLSFDLRPVQSFGSWCGGDPLGGYRSDPAPGAVLVLTHSRPRARRLRRFMVADGPVVRALADQEGQLWADGFVDRVPTMDSGTVSVWRDTAAATRFAYAPGVHQEAVKAQRDEGWFSESWFARFAVLQARGAWPSLDVPALQAAMRRPATAPG